MSGLIDVLRCPLCPAVRLTDGEMNGHVRETHDVPEFTREVLNLRAKNEELAGKLAGVLGVVADVLYCDPPDFTAKGVAEALARCVYPDGIPPDMEQRLRDFLLTRAAADEPEAPSSVEQKGGGE
jgi:hypothetical protein